MIQFIGDKVLRVLVGSYFVEEAHILARQLDALKSQNLREREDAIYKIVGLCNIRAFGDLNIQNMNGWEWNSLLQKLKKYAISKQCK